MVKVCKTTCEGNSVQIRDLIFVLAFIVCGCSGNDAVNLHKPVMQVGPDRGNDGVRADDRVSPMSPGETIHESKLSVSIAWTIEELGAPVAVAHEALSNELLLSQIGGEGDAKDGDGVISRISLEGEMRKFSWSKGFNAPKDLVIDEDSIWVSDIDTVYELDRDSGAIRRKIVIPDARFLVGITKAPDKRLFLADLLSSRIYTMNDGVVQVLKDGPELQSPSRLLFANGDLVVAAWGLTPDFSGQAVGDLYSCGQEPPAVRKWNLPMQGHWMGMCSDGTSGLFLADFETGIILHVLKDRTCEKVGEFGHGVGGLLYLPQERLLLVTHVTENRLVALRFTETVATLCEF